MMLGTYRHLFAINRGFDRVIRGLEALTEEPLFVGNELKRFRDLCAETRADLNSYLTETIAVEETQEGGRLFRKRRSFEAKKG